MFHHQCSISRSAPILILCIFLFFTPGFSPSEVSQAETQVVFQTGQYVPAYPPLEWQAFARDGLNGDVYTIVLSGTDLYIGGNFNETGDSFVNNLGNIVRYDLTTGEWYPLACEGLNDNVYALVVKGDDLFVGGNFTATVGNCPGTPLKDLGGIVRYDTVDETWNPLPHNGLNDSVNALALSGSSLYVGGRFTASGDTILTNLNYIAHFHTGNNLWYQLPDEGLDDVVFTLALSGDDLYAGGDFDGTGDGSVKDMGGIARCATKEGTWYTLPNTGFDGRVYTLAVSKDNLYAGGEFSETRDGSVKNLGHIAHYDGVTNTWIALSKEGLSGTVNKIVISETDLYLAGEFKESGDGTVKNLNRIAQYETNAGAWNPLPNKGLNDEVFALAAHRDNLYVGGQFFQTADGNIKDINSIVRCALKGYPADLKVTAMPTHIGGDGFSTSKITAAVSDTHGLPAPNLTVTFTTTLGSLDQPTAVTDENGKAFTRLTSITSDEIRTAEVSAVVDNISGSVDVVFVPYSISLPIVMEH